LGTTLARIALAAACPALAAGGSIGVCAVQINAQETEPSTERRGRGVVVEFVRFGSGRPGARDPAAGRPLRARGLQRRRPGDAHRRRLRLANEWGRRPVRGVPFAFGTRGFGTLLAEDRGLHPESRHRSATHFACNRATIRLIRATRSVVRPPRGPGRTAAW
jgi:hypothetical protein